MLIVTVKLDPIFDCKQLFMDRFNQLANTVRKEEGCLEYELYQKNSQSSEMFIFERWESQLALENHLETEHMQRFFAEAAKWFNTQHLIERFEVIKN